MFHLSFIFHMTIPLNRPPVHHTLQLLLVASVHSHQPTIQSLFKSNDFCAALDLVSSTQELLSAPDTPSLACLRHLSAQLTEIARFVQNMVVAEFQVAIQDCLDKKTFLNLSSEDKSVAVSSAFTLSEDASDVSADCCHSSGSLPLHFQVFQTWGWAWLVDDG
ncbi:Vacuolar protein sorting-associated protein 54 [Sparganum proliferum]